jgi:hypothetical protein
VPGVKLLGGEAVGKAATIWVGVAVCVVNAVVPSVTAGPVGKLIPLIVISIAWQYTAEMSNRPSWSFFSHYISSAQRQPNGNTLICEGSNGRFFEVTPSGEIVWEYINPFPNLSGKIPNGTVFRVAKVPEDWLKR